MSAGEVKTFSDEELAEQYLKTRNNYFFELIYHRFSRKVFGKCMALLKDESLAQDATQEVLMKVLLNLSKFKGGSKLSTWIYSITYNFCIDFIRKRKKLQFSNLDDSEELRDTYDEEVEDKVLLEVKYDVMKEAMEKIPADDKAVLMMKYMDNMSIIDICEVLDKSESAIKMKIKRAKLKLVKVTEKAF
jgi:RNA polymerase sigma-70 factor (ECF subfamily)